jgi:hypothetical protein
MRIPPEMLLAIRESEQPDYSGEEQNASKWCFSYSIVEKELVELGGATNYEHDSKVLVLEGILAAKHFGPRLLSDLKKISTNCLACIRYSG